MLFLSRIFGQKGKLQEGQRNEVADPKTFNQAACFGGKVFPGEDLTCISTKSREWPYPVFRRTNGVPADAPHGTSEIIKMSYKAKGNPESYGLKTIG